MKKLLNICYKYKNITKKQLSKINLTEYEPYAIFTFSLGISPFNICCDNNNFLIIKYFCELDRNTNKNNCHKIEIVKTFKYILISCGILEYICSNALCLNILKYLIDFYDFIKKDILSLKCLQLCCEHNDSLKILKYLIKKFDISKQNILHNDKLYKNMPYGDNCLRISIFNNSYKIFIYLVKKFNITVNDIMYNKIFKKYFGHYNIIKYVIIKYKLNKNNISHIFNIQYFYPKQTKLMSCNINIITNKYINYNKIFKTIYL